MPRPCCPRRIRHCAKTQCFKPAGVPACQIEAITLQPDEWEAVRLCDLEEFYQLSAASQMEISRQTLGRILRRAHKKIADAIVNGKALHMAPAVKKRAAKPASQTKKAAKRIGCD